MIYAQLTRNSRICSSFVRIELSLSEFSSDCADLRTLALGRSQSVTLTSISDSNTAASLTQSPLARATKLSPTPLTRPLQARNASTDADNASESPPIRLMTLEEHRFATRFEKKRVTLKTWRAAKTRAYALMATSERASLAEALYLLLEVLWLRPRDCALAPLYLNAGSIYLTFDRLDDAAKAYRNALRLDPTSWKARFNLGVALARAQDFVDAKHQFDAALQLRPPHAGVTRDIVAMIAEIDAVVCERNARAFSDVQAARTFTTAYLSTLHSVAANARAAAQPVELNDHTQSYSSRPQRTSPLQLYDTNGWVGAIAGLLHRLYTQASARGISVEQALADADASKCGSISTDELERIVAHVTGSRFTESERTELALVCDDRCARLVDYRGTAVRLTDSVASGSKLLVQILVPNAETLAAVDAMQRNGISRASLHWSLTRKRLQRSDRARHGGLWRWLELSMTTWIVDDLALPAALVPALIASGWSTPMDIVLRPQCVDAANAPLPLSFAERGVFVFESHCAREAITREAATVLQMFARRVIRAARRAQSAKARALGSRIEQRAYVPQSSAIADLEQALYRDTIVEHEIVSCVLECLDALVDSVVASIRLERRAFEEHVRWQEIPVRTEKRQATAQAVGMLQSLMATRT